MGATSETGKLGCYQLNRKKKKKRRNGMINISKLMIISGIT